MRRISKHDCLTTNPSSAFKYSISTSLVALLLLSLGPAATFAQSDPFTQTKPAAANPFADVSPSDTNNQVPNQSVTPDAASTSGNAFDEISEDSDLQVTTDSANSSQTTSEQISPAVSQQPPADTSETNNPQETKPLKSAVPEPAEDLSVARADAINRSVAESSSWMNWLIDNWYWPAAIVVLALLGLLFSKYRIGKKNLGQPRIKQGGGFKKSSRFQDGENEGETLNLEEVTSELGSSEASSEGIDVCEASDVFDFEEAASSELSESESSPVAGAATALTGDAVSIDDDDDFLELMMDETEEASATKLTDDTDGLGDVSLQESDVKVGQSVPSETPDMDDDDFLDLMLDETEETDATKLLDDSVDLGDVSPQESEVEVVQSVPSETPDVDDDDFFDMMLDGDEDSLQTDEGVAPLAQSTESHDIGAPVESQEQITLDDDSDEFTFDFEDDTPAETEPLDALAQSTSADLADEDLTDTSEEIIVSDVDDEPTPPSGITFSGNDEMLIDVASDSDFEDIELNDDLPSVAGGVTAAAAGVAAGFGALLATRGSSDSDQPSDDTESEELREQLAQAQQKEQQNAAEISAQQTELETLKAKLNSASASTEELDRLKTEVQDFKEDQLASTETKEKLQQHADELESKLEAAEKSASEFEAKLVAAESNIDALEKEKQEFATELESKSDDSEAIEKLEKELAISKSESDETSAANEKLQSEAEQLRKEVGELREINEQKASESGMPSGSLVAASLSQETAGDAAGIAANASADSSEFQQLKAQFDEELALRKQTEAMLVEAEQQRTDVAMALRDLRKQTKEQNDAGGASEELDTLKNQLADSESANEKLEQQLDSFRKKLEQEYSVAKELNGKLNLLQEKVSAATIHENEWTQKLESLESDVETKNKETSRLTADLQSTKESLGKSEETVAELQANEDNHKSTLAKYEATLLESQSNLESAITEKSQIEVSLDDLKAKAGSLSYGQLEEALASVAKLSEERSGLGLKLEQTRTTGEEAARQNAQLAERVAQLEKQLDSSSEIADQLSEARKQLDEEKNRAIEADKQNNALQLQVDSLKQNFESLDRQRLSLKENLEARDKEAVDVGAAVNKETAKLTQKIAALEQSLSNTDGAEDLRLQLADGKEQLGFAKEQNSILAERVSGLEQQLKSRHADSEKLDSVEQQLASQSDLLTVAKEDNATLRERVDQLNEQIKIARDRSGKLEQTANELAEEKAQLSEMSQASVASQQRIKLLEEQVARGKEVSLQLSEASAKLVKTSSERVALQQKSEGLLLQLDRASGITEKNEQLNQQVGFLQRDLEVAKKSNHALEERLKSGTSADGTGSVDSDKLERILGQLESQNRQISRLVTENKKMAAQLALPRTASTKKASSSNTASRTKAKGIPKGCDDLTKIVGIGPKYRGELYKAGVKTYRQIAGWTKEDVTKYGKKLGAKGKRIEREEWVSQAKKLS